MTARHELCFLLFLGVELTLVVGAIMLWGAGS
jgi:hypothetical protein